MKSRFNSLIALSALSISLLLISPLGRAAFVAPAESAMEEEPLFEGGELIIEETPFQEWHGSVDPSLFTIYQQLKEKKFDAALEAAQQLRKKQLDSPDLLTLMGLANLGKGETERAKELFEQALKLDPGNPNAAMNLARMALQQGHFDEARGYYQDILKYHPGDQAALLMQDKLVIRDYLQAKDFDAALKSAQQLRLRQPDNPDPVTLMGMAHFGKGDTEQAKTLLEEALKLAPGDPNAAVNLAQMASQAGHFDQARGYLQQILDHHPGHQTTLLMLAALEAKQGNKDEALAHLQEAIKQHPKDLAPLVALARFQLNNGDAAKALETLQTVPERYADHPLLLATLGEAQLTAGDWSNALHSLQKWLELQPESARAHYLVGAAYLGSKDRAAAMKALIGGLKLKPDLLEASQLMTLLVSAEPKLEEKDKIVAALKKVQPEHPQVLDLEAQLALLHGDANRAVAIYQGLQQRFPDTSVWVQALARARWQAGEKDNSLRTLNGWLKAHPDDVDVRYRLAGGYMQLQREEDAKRALLQVIQHAPDYAPALNNLAWLLRDEDPKQALAYAERANQQSPNNPAILDTLGVLSLRDGNETKALKLLEQARALRPADASVAFHYAQALSENGRRDQARQVLNDIRGKEFPEKGQAQALYESLNK